ncbi:molybdenum cofactor guanylyltransferase [Pleionea sediminis]|uniref:molybdenum cofactor guanylyltransferase n=1 Tax=Pleionea sediminis TaxID=2569479 RepID=UPI0011864416|nr:molybdenum cofactor guanylyltransferase [Pleionea sediminis]
MIGIVLAGGSSTRMQKDKALIQHPVKPLQSWLDHALEILMKVGCRKVIVSGKEHDGIPDNHLDKGPLAGIYSVAKSISVNKLLIIPVDMPLLHESLLADLVSESDYHSNVYFKDSFFPMVITWEEQYIDYLERVLNDESSDCSVRTFLAEINAVAIDCERPQNLMNVNTPDDLERLKQLSKEDY